MLMATAVARSLVGRLTERRCRRAGSGVDAVRRRSLRRDRLAVVRVHRNARLIG